MNEPKPKSNIPGTATVILLSFLLFYFPSMLAILSKDDAPWEWTMLSIVMATLYTAIFCVNYFWLVPVALIRNDRKIMFFLTNFFLISLACSLIPLWFESHGGLPRPQHAPASDKFPSIWEYLMLYVKFIIRDGIMMILAAALAYALRLSREHENVRRRELELDAERRRIELKSLKAQLNPHFLFNSLNNIYALIAISPDRAQTALHDLSSMLRFMIYDAAYAFVPLEKESKFICDYVALMKLRMSSSTKIECEISTLRGENLNVAPLLFLTLVENAFKHVSCNVESSFISICLCVRDEKLICMVSNSCGKEDASKLHNAAEPGVGLKNVERQLGLLYPGHYSMKLDKAEGVFTAVITIDTEALLRQEVKASEPSKLSDRYEMYNNR